jgi:hypothetical protein
MVESGSIVDRVCMKLESKFLSSFESQDPAP